MFDTQHPDFTFVNAAVAGGGGSQAKQKLAADLAAQNPPDSFQAHAGEELSDYIDALQIEDVSYLYDKFDLREAFPATLIDRLTVDGKIYSVPTNVHRANVVWANPAVLEEAGIDPAQVPADIDSWIADMEKVKAAGKIPITVGMAWTQLQLLETVLMAELGADGYTGLFDGKTAWDVMGDWAIAAFDAADKVYGTDYLAFPVPGTEGMFDFLADSFTLPVGAPNVAGAEAWMETISSMEGQITFNTIKGSIPARSDLTEGDIALFSEYQQDAMKAFAEDTIVSSIAHGAATPVAVSNAMNDAVAKFSQGASDVAGLQAELTAAAAPMSN